MRPLTPSERTLLTVTLALAFGFANLIGIPWIKQQQSQILSRIQELKGQELSAKSWLGEKALWTERQAWVEANQPKCQTGEDISSGFVEMLQSSAKQNNIKIIEQKLLTPEKHPPAYQTTAIHMAVNGNLESIVKWLSTIQQPKLFQAVTQFNLKIDGEAPNMRCDLDLSRWYAPSP